MVDVTMRTLYRKVERETGAMLTDGVRKHAAWQAMDAYLEDWRAAYELLGQRVASLQQMHDERKAETAAGTWPASLDDNSHADCDDPKCEHEL